LSDCRHRRDGPAWPDATWIHLGVKRVRHEWPSGRAFLQEHAFPFPHCPPRAHSFESLKRARRLKWAGELNGRLCQHLTNVLPDALATSAELADFDLDAGEGHGHGAAAHDAPLDDTKYAVGHCYALDLRRHTLRPLAVGQGKKEHDMHVLKRLNAQALRQHAAQGRKVLSVWDKAGIDFPAWQRWKQASGVDVVSLEKKNMNREVMGLPEWDRHDPVNAGIHSVELVAGQAGVLLRRIRYIEPVTGTEYVFLTSELNLRPGIIAFLSKRRWDIEKVFDQMKNKLREQKAWATTDTAKSVQAQLICLCHNLLQLLQERLRLEGIENHAEMDRQQKEFAKAQAFAAAAGRPLPTCVAALQRLTQCSVKLLRWLRSSLDHRLAWHAATPRLRLL
jgi:hypothetical protein